MIAPKNSKRNSKVYNPSVNKGIAADTWGDHTPFTFKTEEDDIQNDINPIETVTVHGQLGQVIKRALDSQPSVADMKNRHILDSFKPLHLINTLDSSGGRKYFVTVKQLLELGLLDASSTL